MKHHVNLAGEVKPCDADVRTCRFGFHSESREESERLLEESQADEMFAPIRAKKAPGAVDVEHEKKSLDAILERSSLLSSEGRRHEKALMSAYASRTAMSNKELTRRLEYVNMTNAYLEKSGFTTEKLYSQGELGDSTVYTEQRARAHQEIIDEYMREHEDVPNEGRSIVAGGLGGSGKGSTMRNEGISQSEYATVDPDEIKQKMADRGMIPKVTGMTPMEASPLVHEEASHMSKQIAHRLMAQKKNMVYDVTMAGLPSSRKKLTQLRENGYTVRGIFVDIEPAVSKERGRNRYIEGMQSYTREHKGSGGRPLPEALVDNQRSSNLNARSKNAVNLATLSNEGHFDSDPDVFDNMGSSPRRVAYRDFAEHISRGQANH